MPLGAGAVHLPDGQNYEVKPVFAGMQFKCQQPSDRSHPFPVGWSVVIRTEHDVPDDLSSDGSSPCRKMYGWSKPTLQDDCLFISSISSPSIKDFGPTTGPTREMAMLLWITLYWYFHQHEPEPFVRSDATKPIPDAGKPRGEWSVAIKRDGVFRAKNLMAKLERMGLITSLNSAVGTDADDISRGWDDMFVTRRMFWQLPGRLFLFNPRPNRPAPRPGSCSRSPTTSRPTSPVKNELPLHPMHSPSPQSLGCQRPGSDLSDCMPPLLVTAPSFPVEPFYSSSHLPTYYPPAPPIFVMTDGIRHPVRPKPPRMGEVFYSRFIPSIGRYLSFRVASLSSRPVLYCGPLGPKSPDKSELLHLTDSGLVERWLGVERVREFWGSYEPGFLSRAVSKKHSFPAIGMWDGVPFGYFEIYWVKEDILGKHLGEAGDWDRGMHVLVGEEWSRGRVPYWLSSLVHWCLMADYRTMNVCLEPRVDNARLLLPVRFVALLGEGIC